MFGASGVELFIVGVFAVAFFMVVLVVFTRNKNE